MFNVGTRVRVIATHAPGCGELGTVSYPPDPSDPDEIEVVLDSDAFTWVYLAHELEIVADQLNRGHDV